MDYCTPSALPYKPLFFFYVASTEVSQTVILPNARVTSLPTAKRVVEIMAATVPLFGARKQAGASGGDDPQNTLLRETTTLPAPHRQPLLSHQVRYYHPKGALLFVSPRVQQGLASCSDDPQNVLLDLLPRNVYLSFAMSTCRTTTLPFAGASFAAFSVASIAAFSARGC